MLDVRWVNKVLPNLRYIRLAYNMTIRQITRIVTLIAYKKKSGTSSFSNLLK